MSWVVGAGLVWWFGGDGGEDSGGGGLRCGGVEVELWSEDLKDLKELSCCEDSRGGSFKSWVRKLGV